MRNEEYRREKYVDNDLLKFEIRFYITQNSVYRTIYYRIIL